MDKKSKQVFMFAALCLATTAMLSFSASCSLTGMQFGFPVIVQKGATSAFSQDVASATDLENINIDFPQFNDLMSGSGMPASGFTNGGSMTGSMMPGMGSMGHLFDFSGFKLH